MHKFVRTLVLSAVAAASAGSLALAEPSCSNWLQQTDGSWWRQCVNDDGSVHCYSATDNTGARATEISCKN